MLQLLLFVNLILPSVHAQAAEVSACEAALRDQTLPDDTIRRATSLARAHVIARDLADEADLGKVRLLAHAPHGPDVLDIEAEVEMMSRAPRYVSLKFDKHLVPFSGRIVAEPSPPAAAALADWPRDEGPVRFLPARPLTLDAAGLKNIGRVALRHLQVARAPFNHVPDISVLKVIRANPDDARALVRVSWTDVNGPESRHYFVVTNAAGEGYTSEDEPVGHPPDYAEMTGALIDHLNQHSAGVGQLLEYAFLQENGKFWAIERVRVDGHDHCVWLEFGEGRHDGRIVAHRASSHPQIEKTPPPPQFSPATTARIQFDAQEYVLRLDNSLSARPHVDVVGIKRAEPTDVRALVAVKIPTGKFGGDWTLEFWIASQGPGLTLASRVPLPDRLPNLALMTSAVDLHLKSRQLRWSLPGYAAVLELNADGYRAHALIEYGFGVRHVVVAVKDLGNDTFEASMLEAPK